MQTLGPYVSFIIMPIFAFANAGVNFDGMSFAQFLEPVPIGICLGLFIGKTLLEKNFASILCRNSKTRSGAEVIIKWSNRDLFKI